MTSKDPISAKVAALIGPYEVAFNVGALNGVQKGDHAIIFRYVVVKDPDTKAELGVVKRPALTLRIVEVRERMCVGQSSDFYKAGDTSTVGAFLRLPVPDMRRVEVTSRQIAESREAVYVAIGQEATIQPREQPAEEQPAEEQPAEEQPAEEQPAEGDVGQPGAS